MQQFSFWCALVDFEGVSLACGAGWCDKINGSVLPAEGPFHAYTLHEPIGVVGSILPWNAPFYLLAMKVAPALACGNTIVLKPAHQSPLSALLIAKLAAEVS